MAGKRQYRNPNYLKAVVIVHGQSENLFAKYITSKLKFGGKVEYYGRGNRKFNIQFTYLRTLLDSKHFKSMNEFVDHYGKDRFNITGRGKNKKLNGFRLYIVMDTDECLNDPSLVPLKDSYLDKSMFIGHWLYDYIVPIYSIHDLEDVMVDIKLMDKKITDGEKIDWYEKKMPKILKQKTGTENPRVNIEYLRDACKKSRKTNQDDFIDYCLSNIKQFK